MASSGRAARWKETYRERDPAALKQDIQIYHSHQQSSPPQQWTAPLTLVRQTRCCHQLFPTDSAGSQPNFTSLSSASCFSRWKIWNMLSPTPVRAIRISKEITRKPMLLLSLVLFGFLLLSGTGGGKGAIGGAEGQEVLVLAQPSTQNICGYT